MAKSHRPDERGKNVNANLMRLYAYFVIFKGETRFEECVALRWAMRFQRTCLSLRTPKKVARGSAHYAAIKWKLVATYIANSTLQAIDRTVSMRALSSGSA